MKKIITFLMAATLILGFAGISMAADVNCAECVAPGIINRACPAEQFSCPMVPFDYEDIDQFGVPNYCDDAGKKLRKLIFPVCDCEDYFWGDVIDIRMEILVNGETGDNGVYWAEDVDGPGIDLEAYVSQTEACKGQDYVYGSFAGGFVYKYYDQFGVQRIGQVLEGTQDCSTFQTSAGVMNRVTIIEPNIDAVDHGFIIPRVIDLENRSNWAIDIPNMVFDPTVVAPGDVITVQICLAKALDGEVDLGGICGTTGCCCTFTVGTLGCCEGDSAYKLIYPYATPMNHADWWYGFVITNLTGADGEADITVYETDGDTATITVTVGANNMYVKSMSELMTAFGGTIGDQRAYFEVSTNFNANGFFFIGNGTESMGYLPYIPANRIPLMLE